MEPNLSQFDAAEYLTEPEAISAYLTDALENEDGHGLDDALADVIRAKGGAERVSSEVSLPVSVTMRALSTTEKPDLDALLQVLHGLGIRLSAQLVA